MRLIFVTFSEFTIPKWGIVLLVGTAWAFGGSSAWAQTFHEHVVTTSALTVQSTDAADIDEDGDTDVLAASFESDQVAWYENRQDQPIATHVISENMGGAYCLHVADVNGNGHPDIPVGALHDDSITLFSNDGEVTPYGIFAANVNGDQHLDILAATYEHDQIVWYANNGDGTFETAASISGSAQEARGVFAADVNGDGTKDVLSASGGNDEVSWYDNSDSGFVENTIRRDASGASSVFATDATGDGMTDVLSAAIGSDEIILYENTTDGEVVTFREREISRSAAGAQSVYAADIGEDGDVDILSASRSDNTVALYENDGTGTFTERVLSNTAKGARSVSAADMDGDGDSDVLAASQGDDTVRWFETNLHPLAQDTMIEVKEDQILTASPGALGNDQDPDGDKLTARRLSTPFSGTLSGFGGDGSFRFDATGAFDSLPARSSETLSFQYEAEDQDGLVDTATVTLSVIDVNDRPSAQADEDTIHGGEEAIVAVLNNDTNVDGQLDPASVSLAELPANGSVSASGDGKITYNPTGGYRGTDNFDYVVSDGTGETDTATVAITVQSPPPQLIRAEGGDQRAHFSWKAPENTNVQAYKIYQTTPFEGERGDPLTVIQDPITTEYQATSLTNRKVYDFFVTAVGAGKLEGAAAKARVVPRTSTIGLGGSVSFGDQKETRGYRMVGLPGAPEGTKLASTLSGRAGHSWVAYAASGITAPDELVKYGNGGATFGFKRGKGFWVLSKKAWSPEGNVSVASLDEGAVAKIGIPKGWSVITNPFPKPVSWARVKQATPGFDAPLWGFEGKFSEHTTLTPYDGFYVFNAPSQPIDSLRIPYPVQGDSSVTSGHRKQMRAGKPHDETDRFVLRAHVDGKISSEGSVSEAHIWVGGDAVEGQNSKDQFAPPSIGRKKPRLLLHSETASSAYPWLHSEARPVGSDQIATFDLRLSSPSGRAVQLSVPGFTGLSSSSVYLYDRRTERVYDLRAETARIPNGGEFGDEYSTRRLEVWVGDPDQLSERREQ